MSSKQWGHGYHSGRRAAKAKKQIGYVGLFFFTTKEDGRLEYQGQIRRRIDKDRWAVQHHEWFMGDPNGPLVIVSREELSTFRLFEDGTSLRYGIHDYQMRSPHLYPDYSSENFERWEKMLESMYAPPPRRGKSVAG